MKTIVIFIKSMAAAGGIERVISNLTSIWSKKYHVILLVKDKEKKSFYSLPEEVEFISIDEPLILDMQNRTQRIFSVFMNLFRSHLKLKRILSNLHFDYIYTTTSMNGLEVFWANPKYKSKMIVSEHASAFAVNSIYQRIKKYLYPKVKCVSVPNKMDCEVYKSWGCTTQYIPHLVTFHSDYRNDLQSKIVINIGRYTADKRQKDLIEIWSKIKDKKGWQLWIVGSGEEESNLIEAIKLAKEEDTITLIPHTQNIKDIYIKASLFVFTSRMEGFGMVLLEAMAFGIPCISYDCPSGPRDVIVDQYNGMLIENGNKKQFSEAIELYINNSDSVNQKLGKNAYNTVEEWDNQKISTQWDELFET